MRHHSGRPFTCHTFELGGLRSVPMALQVTERISLHDLAVEAAARMYRSRATRRSSATSLTRIATAAPRSPSFPPRWRVSKRSRPQRRCRRRTWRGCAAAARRACRSGCWCNWTQWARHTRHSRARPTTSSPSGRWKVIASGLVCRGAPRPVPVRWYIAARSRYDNFLTRTRMPSIFGAPVAPSGGFKVYTPPGVGQSRPAASRTAWRDRGRG
jgi:hypothetical protein